MDKRKYVSQVKITKEMMESILGIPSPIELQNVSYDASRDIVSFHLKSKELVKGVFETGEGQEHITTDATEWLLQKRKEIFKEILKSGENELANDLVEGKIDNEAFCRLLAKGGD